MWRERGSSPGFGLHRSPSRPTGQWHRERALLPVTVAGPHRHHTGFRFPRSPSVVHANLDALAFRGKRGGLIKILWHDGQGMCLLAKRLERGRFVWPRTEGEAVATW